MKCVLILRHVKSLTLVRCNLYSIGNTADGFFLRMSHGESITTYGGQREKEDPFQCICQGNGTGPAVRVGVRSMLQNQRAPVHGAKVTNFISISLLLLVDLLYVDDGELLEASNSGKE